MTRLFKGLEPIEPHSNPKGYTTTEKETETMKEYLIRVYRVYDIYVEAEDLEAAEELAQVKAGEGYLCADESYCECLGCEVIEE